MIWHCKAIPGWDNLGSRENVDLNHDLSDRLLGFQTYTELIIDVMYFQVNLSAKVTSSTQGECSLFVA